MKFTAGEMPKLINATLQISEEEILQILKDHVSSSGVVPEGWYLDRIQFYPADLDGDRKSSATFCYKKPVQ